MAKKKPTSKPSTGPVPPGDQAIPRGDYSVRLLEWGGAGRKVQGSGAIEDDPFMASGLYGVGPRKFTLPPLGEGSLRMLTEYGDESNILPQCVKAYMTNIDGFGHRFDYVVPDREFPESLVPTAQRERDRLEQFYTYGYHEGTFRTLRQRVRKDAEYTGIGYIELIRDLKGQVVRMNTMPSWTVRMTPPDPQEVEITEVQQVGLTQVVVKYTRRFRIFLQIIVAGGRLQRTFFKEFGDPRRLSSRTGEWLTGRSPYEASELLPLRCEYHAVTPYGLPRWIGNLPSILGSRAAEEINLLYFDNKTIPPMIITVAGGQLTQGSVDRIRDVIEYEIKGRENFHKALILEAVPSQEAAAGARGNQRMSINVTPMTNAMIQDALFVNYDRDNRLKVRSSLRLAPLLVGETTEYNRATAEMSLLVNEEQVFRPERVQFDSIVNRRMQPELGAQYLKFVSIGPNVTLNEDLVQLLSSAENTGGLTPNLARQIMSDILEKELPQIAEPWGNLPYSMTMGKMAAEASAADSSALAAETGDSLSDDPEEDDATLAEKLAARLPREVRVAVARQLMAAARGRLVARGGP